MNRTIQRLKKAILRSRSYEQFESIVLAYPKWYLEGLQLWTKADLRKFYDEVTQNKKAVTV